jgi:hypothetical protein
MTLRSDVDKLVRRLTDAGGVFVRHTGTGHRLYRIKQRYLTVPSGHGSLDGRALRNVAAEIERAIKAVGVVVETDEERAASRRGMKPSEVEATIKVVEPAVNGGGGDTVTVVTTNPLMKGVDGRYHCDLCSFSSRAPQGIKAHARRHEKSALVACPKCGKEVKVLKSHMSKTHKADEDEGGAAGQKPGTARVGGDSKQIATQLRMMAAQLNQVAALVQAMGTSNKERAKMARAIKALKGLGL